MGLLSKERFVCVDCESTGLDVEKDAIIEVAAVSFDFEQIFQSYESLVDPCQIIPEDSIKIHHITNDMVKGKPKIQDILPELLSIIEGKIIMGHGIGFDINLIAQAAKRFAIPCRISSQISIDTLRLGRLYGQTSVNSLDVLRQHFNIPSEGAHRAMNDVMVNIEVFKFLAASFKTTQSLLERLKKPIPMKTMPLGKYKGRIFKDIPTEYLQWACHQNFDQDLLFSLSLELKKRKKGNIFSQAASPFSNL